MRLFLLMLYFLFLESCTTIDTTKEIIKAGKSVKTTISEIVSNKKDGWKIIEKKNIKAESEAETQTKVEIETETESQIKADIEAEKKNHNHWTKRTKKYCWDSTESFWNKFFRKLA